MTMNNDIPKKPQLYIDDNITSVETNLEFGEDVNKNKIHIMVEGDDDSKILKHLLSNNYNIKPYSGKLRVINKVKEKKSFNIIGIVDMDYEKNLNIDRIFMYDCCCLEMMIIKEQTIQNKINTEYGIDKNLIFNILKELLFVSLMRKYNYYHKLEISFKPLHEIIKCYNKKENKIDNKKIIELLIRIKQNEEIIKNYDYNQIIIKINNIKNFDVNKLFNITNGHDFFRIISSYIKNNNQEILWTFIRGIYNKNIFKKTNLYKSLLEYQSKINIIFL